MNVKVRGRPVMGVLAGDHQIRSYQCVLSSSACKRSVCFVQLFGIQEHAVTG